MLGAGVEKSGTCTKIFVSRRMWMNIFWLLAVALASMWCGRLISFCYCAVCPEHTEVRHKITAKQSRETEIVLS
jgi:hypothetical protein